MACECTTVIRKQHSCLPYKAGGARPCINIQQAGAVPWSLEHLVLRCLTKQRPSSILLAQSGIVPSVPMRSSSK